MSLFPDTSVWSLALRRDRPADLPEAGALERALIDAILAQLCIRYELRLLTADADFARIAGHEPLERWTP